VRKKIFYSKRNSSFGGGDIGKNGTPKARCKKRTEIGDLEGKNQGVQARKKTTVRGASLDLSKGKTSRRQLRRRSVAKEISKKANPKATDKRRTRLKLKNP